MLIPIFFCIAGDTEQYSFRRNIPFVRDFPFVLEVFSFFAEVLVLVDEIASV
jgi:hypothetical protein